MTGTTGTGLDEIAIIVFSPKEKAKLDELSPLILNADERYIKFVIEKQIPQQNTHYCFKHS